MIQSSESMQLRRLTSSLDYFAALVVTAFLLSACGGQTSLRSDIGDGPGDQHVDETTPDAVPRREPKSRYGNPASYVVMGRRYHVLNSSQDYLEKGIASWYGRKFHGRRTSSGEPYDMYAMTAAHKKLPLPTYAKVTNLENRRSIIVRVNDRGPFHDNRLIDLSYVAAKKLGIVTTGTGLVEVRALNPGVAESEPLASKQTAKKQPSVYIQVGAFTNPQNAELMRNLLKDYNLGKIHIQEGNHRQQTIFRVRIGPLASVELADQTSRRLNQLGVQDHRVTID
jgi:rare lipoprotein A